MNDLKHIPQEVRFDQQERETPRLPETDGNESPTRKQLVGMIATMRGQLYEYLFDLREQGRDIRCRELEELLKATQIDVNEETDMLRHADGGPKFDLSWRFPPDEEE